MADYRILDMAMPRKLACKARVSFAFNDEYAKVSKMQ